MKTVLIIILFILAIGFVGFLMPSIIGIMIGVSMIKEGSIIGGLAVIAIGIGINIAMLYGSSVESGSYSGADDDCPYCGSGDTDGNHCYTCDDDF